MQLNVEDKNKDAEREFPLPVGNFFRSNSSFRGCVCVNCVLNMGMLLHRPLSLSFCEVSLYGGFMLVFSPLLVEIKIVDLTDIVGLLEFH